MRPSVPVWGSTFRTACSGRAAKRMKSSPNARIDMVGSNVYLIKISARPEILWFSSSIFCNPIWVKGCMVMMNRPSSAGGFAGNDHQRCGRAPALAAVALIDRPPNFGFGSRHRGVIQQASQLAGAAFGQASAPDLVAGVIRPWIETGERDERIRIAERHPLQRIGQRHAHHGADPHNGLQMFLRFHVLWGTGSN